MNYAYLIKVEPVANNNKYYEMRENEDGTFTATYGRVASTATTRTYPMSLWKKKYEEKISHRKGYVDITHTRAIETSGSGERILPTDDPIIRDIFNTLLNETRENVSKNYTIAVNAVTQAMITEAQSILDSLVKHNTDYNFGDFNKALVELFMILPRNMQRVSDHLLVIHQDNIPLTRKLANEIISSEQDTLDSLRGQVVVQQSDPEGSTSLFDTLGIVVEGLSPGDVSTIKLSLGSISDMYHQGVKVTNKRTLARFTEHVNSAQDKTVMDLWHGSRTQNWISLLEKGLVLYPTNAIITGKMFGYGLYFAPKAKKSLGYTSHSGSYWARGTSNRGYMGIFAVHTGKMKRYDTSQSSLTFEKVSRMGYDSVMGERGRSLYNDEIIVYSESQTTIKYLVELR